MLAFYTGLTRAFLTSWSRLSRKTCPSWAFWVGSVLAFAWGKYPKGVSYSMCLTKFFPPTKIIANTFECFPHTLHITHADWDNPPNNPVRSVWITPFYRWENWSLRGTQALLLGPIARSQSCDLIPELMLLIALAVSSFGGLPWLEEAE